MVDKVEFYDRPGQYYVAETEAQWEAALRAAGLWAPGEYWPYFEQYTACEEAEAEIHINGEPYLSVGGGGGCNSGIMGQPPR